jgi:hypothetical protein
VLSSAAAGAQESTASDRVAFTLGLAATNKYFFRGLLEEDRGAIGQTSLDGEWKLFGAREDAKEDDATSGRDGGGFLRGLSLTFGAFDSLHSGPSGTGGPNSSPAAWYESDWYAGLSAQVAGEWTLSASWWDYTSPNSNWKHMKEVDVGLAYDDSGLWSNCCSGRFGGLQPALALGFELVNQADQNSNPPGTHEGVFLGLSLAPEFTLGGAADSGSREGKGGTDDPHGASDESAEAAKLRLSFPAHAGFSLSNYYEDDAGRDQRFGYADVGATITMPLSFVSKRLGEWELALGAQAVLLGSHARAANHGDGFALVGTATLSISF